MASFSFQIKSGRKGKAVDHAAYIAREGAYRQRGDLVATQYGNLPAWAESNPARFWRAADKYERANGAAYREMVIALPNELDSEQQKRLVNDLLPALVGDKAYQLAIHAPVSSLQGEANPHVHLMVSDRQPDGIDRGPERMFSRYNCNHPAAGGRRKDSGGRTPKELRDKVIQTRELVASIQNMHLAMCGHSCRVDHRTLRERGLSRDAENHLGAARLRGMSTEEKERYVARRRRD